MCEHLEGVGITRDELRPGVVVVVPAGRIPALVNGWPCVIALATVVRQATQQDTGIYTEEFKAACPYGHWWLNVHQAPGVSLELLYRADEILGIPTLGLGMPGERVAQLESRLKAVDDFCVQRQAESVGGTPTDVDTVWPSEIRSLLQGPA